MKCNNEIWIIIDYSYLGDENMIVMSYVKFVVDLELGNIILCFDGIIIMMVFDCYFEKGMVKVRCENIVMLGEKKNVNLFGIVVDLFIII